MHTSDDQHPAFDRNLLKALWGMIGFLILSNILLVPIGGNLASIEGLWGYALRQIDLGSERTFATWCSSMLLLLNSLGAYMFARALWTSRRRVAWLMALLSFGFLFLSVDDFIGFHEYVERQAASLLSSSGGEVSKSSLGPLFATSLAVILATLFAVPYMRVVEREGLPLFIGSIACVCLGALAESVYLASGCAASWCFRIEVVFEEGCELLALLFFLAFQSRGFLTVRKKQS